MSGTEQGIEETAENKIFSNHCPCGGWILLVEKDLKQINKNSY